ncbi:hypothetical protein [Spirosoma sp.]|uniref:hypothetical protein n=1 Tax=Spirosoma sp. TaxID=1899569 RepID=UPI002616C356|nr:hypothetical protein [Spirosoma sp.]MCX6215634.1 hypothetical protein [Spirosoma sp.]
MIAKRRLPFLFFAWLVLLFSTDGLAQKQGPIETSASFQRIQRAPESVFTLFRQAGMQPVNRTLTPVQKEKVRHAFERLPPVHQRILNRHLQSISFMDNMPNTALTSLLDSDGGTNRFNITFRASLLEETISEWASGKENTCFEPTANTTYRVRVEGGNLDAIVYVLMHEATHIVDAVMNITPHPAETQSVVEPTPFTKGLWHKMNVPDDKYLDTLLEKTRFRSGKLMPIRQAPAVYQTLSKTPFPSLYAMAAWSEDIAELATIYHLTSQLNQPFYVVVTKDQVELVRFEPMKSKLVKQRFKQLMIFYTNEKSSSVR